MSNTEGIGKMPNGTNGRIAEPTEEEIEAIWEEFEEFMLPKGGAGPCYHFHLPTPDGEMPRCETVGQFGAPGGHRTRQVAAYPPGYRDICKYCLQHWRENP